jgi:hypothetical protein
MPSRRHRRAFTIAATCAFIMGAGEVSAQSRAAAINVRVTVVRSCTVDTRPGAGPQGTTVTCSRGATPGAVTTSSTTTTPVPQQRTTVDPVAARTAASAAAPGVNVATSAQPDAVSVNAAGEVTSSTQAAAAAPGSSTAESSAGDGAAPIAPVDLPGDDLESADSGRQAVRRVEMVTINF